MGEAWIILAVVNVMLALLAFGLLVALTRLFRPATAAWWSALLGLQVTVCASLALNIAYLADRATIVAPLRVGVSAVLGVSL